MLFSDLKVPSLILDAIKDANYTTMTPVQENIINHALANKCIFAQAPTGTGKTASFVLPTLISNLNNLNDLCILVICPTRELAKQIANEYLKIGKYLNDLNVVEIYGGIEIRKQLRQLDSKPNIIVSTPGRLIDLINRKAINLSTIKSLVIDEIDLMFDMGFINDIKRILSLITCNYQSYFYSATVNDKIHSLCSQYQKNAFIYKDPACDNIANVRIEQFYILAKTNELFSVTLHLLKKFATTTIIFTNSIREAKNLVKFLSANRISAFSIHSDLTQRARENVLAQFKAGKINVLVGTDIISRGIDIANVQVVINLLLPRDESAYTHRIGRTGRANNNGCSYTIVTNQLQIKKLARLSNNTIKPYELTNYTYVEDTTRQQFRDRQNSIFKNNNHHDSSKVRMFTNIGIKDNLDKQKISTLITTNTSILPNQIHDIFLRDTYSFITIDKDCVNELNTIRNFQNRSIFFKVAIDRQSKRFSNTSQYRPNHHYGNKRFDGPSSKRYHSRDNKKFR
jgi:ATP-dependent RNA helicase DeaD